MDKNYSVLMSVYYKEKDNYLRKSIESMINQTCPPTDFVIVCDGPLNDELDSVINNFDKRYPNLFQIVRKPKCQGLGKALNDGLNYCKYDIVARMDSDDIAKSNRMEEQLAIYVDNKVDMVGGTIEEFDGEVDNVIATRILPQNHEDILKFAKQRNPFNHPCMTFRKSSVIAAGGYQDFPLFEDYFLWVRMLMNGAIGHNVQKTLLYMRSGEDMYLRRGGFSYAVKAVRFKKHLLKIGFYSFGEFVKSAGVHVIVSIMPNKLRKLFYKKLLRK